MNHLFDHGILLAQRSRLESLSSGFRGRRARIETDDIVTGLLILAVVAAAIWLLSYLVSRQERRRGYTSPRRLFLSLCKAHRLSWRQRWLLYRVARSQRLGDPGRLFLEPERLQPVNLSPSLRKQANQLKHVCQRLFAEPRETEPKEAGPKETEPKEKVREGKPVDRLPKRPKAQPPATSIPPTAVSPAPELPAWPTAPQKSAGP